MPTFLCHKIGILSGDESIMLHAGKKIAEFMIDSASHEITELMAAKLKLLADSTRLAILRSLIGRDELNVGKLVELTSRSQANVSKHLRQLTDAGLVSRRKEGLQVYYRLSDPLVEKVYQLVRDSILKDLEQN